MSQATISIFERLASDMPPLVPDAIRGALSASIEHVEGNPHLTPKEAESALLSSAKKLWPYRQAFQEFVDVEEGKIGERFLLGKLTPPMKQKYRKFKEYGGTLRDLHSGSPAAFFTSEERGLLCAALVEMHRDIVAHARQLVLSAERVRYENRVVEFQVLFDDIEKRLDTLRRMAEDEEEHPMLAAEIRAQVEGFEHGLCTLGPRVEYAAVCNAAPHFEGRKMEKSRRGRED